VKDFYITPNGPQHLINDLRAQVSDANKFILDTMKVLSLKFESGSYDLENDEELEDFRNAIDEKHNSTLKKVTRIILKFELYNLTKEILRF